MTDDDRASGQSSTNVGPTDAAHSGVLPADRRERVLTLVLLLALVAALIGVVHVAVFPVQTATPFTEFYILGTDGNATGYPTNLTVGETGELIVGITNNEGRSVTYTVVATMDRRQVANRTVTVSDGQNREWSLSFEAQSPGRHRLRILLFKDQRAGDPDDDLRLWVTVADGEP